MRYNTIAKAEHQRAFGVWLEQGRQVTQQAKGAHANWIGGHFNATIDKRNFEILFRDIKNRHRGFRPFAIINHLLGCTLPKA